MYRVKLVPSKTKLLPVYMHNQKPLVDYAKITIGGESVEFVETAEHVGVLRGSTGNTVNLIHRITAHKKSLSAVCSAGLARGQRSNPAAALRVHQLFSLPVLFSGIASTVLNKKDIDILEKHYKETLQNIQKLHTATPRSIVYLLAGSLPAEAVLHCKQIGLFSMICRMKNNPLNKHARYILTEVSASARSWFHGIYELSMKYNLPNPLVLLDNPPPKNAFKRQVKLQVIDYWQEVLRQEALALKSLEYFNPFVHSLTTPSLIWLTAHNSPFECAKAVIVARMISGRYRCEALSSHWSNSKGYCLAPTCTNIRGDVEHLLLRCPALDSIREKMLNMWKSKTETQYPELYAIISQIMASSPSYMIHFLLYPSSFPGIIALGQKLGGEIIDHINYLTRTYVYYLHKVKQKIVMESEISNEQK